MPTTNRYQEYVKIITNVGFNLDNLKRLTLEQRTTYTDQKKHTIEIALKGSLKPFKRYPAVQQFLAQYRKIRSRYKFLVLEGRSGTGKTYFAKWMCGDPSTTLECNCACTPEPDLRDFDTLFHQLILFDEAAPTMVIRQKKLFQSPPSNVLLGSSATN